MAEGYEASGPDGAGGGPDLNADGGYFGGRRPPAPRRHSGNFEAATFDADPDGRNFGSRGRSRPTTSSSVSFAAVNGGAVGAAPDGRNFGAQSSPTFQTAHAESMSADESKHVAMQKQREYVLVVSSCYDQ